MVKVDNRNYGLDILRAIAIIMVLISHSQLFFGQYANLRFLSNGGLIGVELFFVLSGFLIGKIIIKSLVESKDRKSGLIKFYLNRIFRILPAYYVTMLAIILFTDKVFNIESVIFFQNFDVANLSLHPVSWSLAVEQWFYLLVPIIMVIVVGANSKNKGKWFIGCCISLIIGITIYRVIGVLQTNPTWDFGVRKNVLMIYIIYYLLDTKK